MPACSTHVHHRPTFLIQFLSDSRISLVSILPMTQHRLHTRNKNKRRIPVCHHPVQRPHFLDLNGSHQHQQLHWWYRCHNYHPAFQSLAQHLLQCYHLWWKMAGQNCSWQEMSHRNSGNFMNIIPSTCFKTVLLSLLLAHSQAQTKSEAVYPFPRNSIMPTYQQWRENNCVWNVFYAMQCRPVLVSRFLFGEPLGVYQR